MRYRIEVSGLIIVKALDACPYLESAAPERPVAPDARWPFSRSTTLPAPRFARCIAMLTPFTPPPITTTSAVLPAMITSRSLWLLRLRLGRRTVAIIRSGLLGTQPGGRIR